jgi:hypothetical protein
MTRLPAASLVLAAVLALVAACGGQPGVPNPGPTASLVPQPTVDISTVAEAYRPEFNSDPRLPGLYVPPNPGPDGSLLTRDDFLHLESGVRYPLCTSKEIAANEIAGCYNSNPPTSGPHAATPAFFRVFEFSIPKENLVHNMEHGGVIIWYSTTNPGAIATLTRVAQEAIDAGRLVAMTRYDDMEADSIALTSWTRLDKFKAGELTPARVQAFIAANERRFNPEGF